MLNIKSKIIDWGDILGESSDSPIPPNQIIAPKPKHNLTKRGAANNSPSPLLRKTTGFLLITINYPHHTTFDKFISKKQEKVLENIWHNIKNTFDISPDINNHEFEQTKAGRVHLHGIISIHVEKFYIAGLVMDMVKTISNEFPAKAWNVREANFYPLWDRYRGPHICVQYKNKDDDYIKTWGEYITKDKNNNIK